MLQVEEYVAILIRKNSNDLCIGFILENKDLIVSYQNGQLVMNNFHDSLADLLLFHLKRTIGGNDYKKLYFLYKEQDVSYTSIKEFLVGRGRARICSIKEEVKGSDLRQNLPFTLEGRRIIKVQEDKEGGVLLLVSRNEKEKKEEFFNAPVLYFIKLKFLFEDEYEWEKEQNILEKLKINKCIND